VKPHNFDSYRDKYETVSLERSGDGILQITLHNRNEPDKEMAYDGKYDFSFPNVEWGHCFYDVARDPENEVIILTHAGDNYIREDATPYRSNAALVGVEGPVHPNDFDRAMSDQKWLQMNLLSIECPVIAAVRGEAVVHAEVMVQNDIVLCSEDAVFQDLPHFEGGLYGPGDSVHVVWPDLLGTNRGRYFLLTGQRIGAAEALSMGVVAEVLPEDDLLPRAYELARHILRRPRLMRRYTRMMITQRQKESMLAHLGMGLALESLTLAGRPVNEGVTDYWNSFTRN